MAVKVYKNKLQREREAKKEERRNNLDARKNTNPREDRMENLYKKLIGMSEADFTARMNEIEARKGEIASRKTDIEKEISGRTKNGQVISEEVLQGLEEESKKLESEETKLNKEKATLLRFPEIKNQISRIRGLRDKTVIKKKNTLKQTKAELKEAEKTLKAEEKKYKEVESLNKRIKKFEKDSSKDVEISDEAREEYFNNIRKLENIQKELKPLDELKNHVIELETKVKLYETGKSKEDSVINKCNMAWRMLLAGRSWDEITYRHEIDEKENERTIQEPNLHTEDKAENIPEPVINTEPRIIVKDMPKPQAQPETIIEPKETVEPKAQEAENENEEIQEAEIETIQEELPSKIERFEDRHPILSRIPLVARIANRIAERRAARVARAEAESEVTTNAETRTEGEARTEERTQRDVFMEYLREYANKEEGPKKQFGGLEVERKAFERIEKEEKTK